MDYLAQKILNVLEKNVSDSVYIEEKKRNFEQLDRLGSARQIANLDKENKADLAVSLGVSVQDLDVFNKVLSKL